MLVEDGGDHCRVVNFGDGEREQMMSWLNMVMTVVGGLTGRQDR